jgi:hypothetical protein
VQQFGDLLTDGPLGRPYETYYGADYSNVVADAGGFTPVELFETKWTQPMTPDLLVARAASISVVGALEPAERELVLARVREFAESHPDLAGRPMFDFPYVTRVFWCHKS